MEQSGILSQGGRGDQVREALILDTLANMCNHDPDTFNPFDTLMTLEEYKSYKNKFQPKITHGSAEGQRLRCDAEERKHRGNIALRDKQYELAIGFYSEALQAAGQVQNNLEQVGVILSNRSHAFCKVHQFESALEDGKQCVVIVPQWVKAGLRIMGALFGLRKYQEAFGYGVALTMFGTMTVDDRVDFFVNVISYLPHIADYNSLAELDFKPEIWPRIITKLVTKKAWESISIIFQGRGNSSPLLTSYSATNVDLSGLLESCAMADWKTWGQRLAVKLLQKGAKMENLDAGRKYGAHAAFRVGMTTGTYDLMRHLFLRHIPTGDRDRVDAEGNTLMHLACRESYPTKMAAVNLLLDHGLSPLCTNNHNLKPLDLLPPDDQDRNKIIKVMEESGYEESPLTFDVRQTVVTDTLRDQGVVVTIGPSTSGAAVVSRSVSQSYSSSTQPDRAVAHWSQAEVQRWLDEKGISNILSGVAGMDGRQLAELRTVQETAPATFYQLLHHTLGLSLVQLLTLASAIRNLS